jgi:integrase
MSPATEFTSAIGTSIARYVALKQALGHRYDIQRYLLTRFDRFLALRGYLDLTAESFSAWCSSIKHLTPSGRRMRMQIVRQFCLYRRRSEPNCFTPDSSQFPPPQPKPQPYIFSEGEIIRLLLAADTLRTYEFSPLHPQVARLALVLLYTSGLRRGEVTRLTLGDYDPVERVLLVRNSKFYKSRIIPLSADAVREMQRYLEDRGRSGFPRSPDAPLLVHCRGGVSGYSGEGLWQLMRRLFRSTDIRTTAGRLPRVHDLRFTFAFHALLRWYHMGADVQLRLPSLATYMGHVSILSTEYYLPVLGVVAQTASERFEQHCARFLSSALDERGDL